MGTSGVFLSRTNDFSVESLLRSTIVSAYRANLCLYFNNSTTFSDDNTTLYTQVVITDKPVEQDDVRQAVFCIYSIEVAPIIEAKEEGSAFIQVAYFEDLWGIEDMVLHFSYEFMTDNSNLLFWSDSYEWVYNLKDLIRLRNSDFSRDWCYTQPDLQ